MQVKSLKEDQHLIRFDWLLVTLIGAALAGILSTRPSLVTTSLWLVYNLGYHLGWYGFAEMIHRNGIAWLAALPGHNAFQVAINTDQLCVLLNAQGKFEQSEPLYKKSLLIYKQLLSDSSAGCPQVLHSMILAAEDYASLLEVTGRPKEGAQMLEDASTYLEQQGFQEQAARLKARARSILSS